MNIVRKKRLKAFIVLIVIICLSFSCAMGASAVTYGVYLGQEFTEGLSFDFELRAYAYYNSNTSAALDLHSLVSYVANDGATLDSDYWLAENYNDTDYDEIQPPGYYLIRHREYPTNTPLTRWEVFYDQLFADHSYEKTSTYPAFTNIGILVYVYGQDLTNTFETRWWANGTRTTVYHDNLF